MAASDRGKTRAGGLALIWAMAIVPVAEAGWGSRPWFGPGGAGPRPVATAAARPVFGGRAARPLMIAGYAGDVYGPAPRRALVPSSFGAAADRPSGAPCGACGPGR